MMMETFGAMRLACTSGDRVGPGGVVVDIAACVFLAIPGVERGGPRYVVSETVVEVPNVLLVDPADLLPRLVGVVLGVVLSRRCPIR